jgi:hypothetical protein
VADLFREKSTAGWWLIPWCSPAAGLSGSGSSGSVTSALHCTALHCTARSSRSGPSANHDHAQIIRLRTVRNEATAVCMLLHPPCTAHPVRVRVRVRTDEESTCRPQAGRQRWHTSATLNDNLWFPTVMTSN